MHLPEPTGGGDFEQTPAGNHIAICYRFIDLGTQENAYMGETKKQHQVMLSWELSHALKETGEWAGKPFTFHQTFTWSMHEKAKLRQTLESWRGKRFEDSDFGEGGFSTRNLIGVPCFLNLIHKVGEKATYTNLGGIAPLPQGVDKPELVNNPIYFALTQDDFEMTTFSELSEKLRGKIMQSPEWISLQGGQEPGPVDYGVSNGHAEQRIPDDAYEMRT